MSESPSKPVAYRDYGFATAEASHMHQHFMPVIKSLLGHLKPGTRVLDVGCGNGYTCGEFIKLGCQVTGIDLSDEGIAQARKAYPDGRFELMAADESILDNLGEAPFDVVISTEVVEHLSFPRDYARGCLKALKPAGRFICTTPYHGYWKNLALSLFNQWDRHMNPMWDGGHIKLWSRSSLGRMLSEQGFVNLKFRGVGRFPYLWMTMVFLCEKPD